MSRRTQLARVARSKRTGQSTSFPRRKLVGELLEARLVLAQTTGLFFNDPGASDGYVLFSPNTTATTYLIDKNANVVNQWTSAYAPGLLGYLQPDGSLIRDAAPHGQGGNGFINAAGAGGLLERFDWDGTKNWDFAYDSPTHLAHHDFEIMPNGNILLIAWELKTEAEATTAGRDPNLPGPGYLYPDHIVEVLPDFINGGGTIVWEWHVWDHLVQEYDVTKSNWQGATGVEDHPELVDINFVSTFDEGAGDGQDWTHANGIDYNADLDQIVLSVREFSEFWIIDHSTTTAQAATHSGGSSGKGGDLLYRWGNPQAYDTGDASDRVLYYQHDARWIDDGSPGAGNITVFNNGLGQPGDDLTRAQEIVTPVDVNGDYALTLGQAYGPAAPVWTYTAAPEDFSAIISSAQRLPNGNTLIDYGVKGTFSEVTPAGDEVWRYVSPYITSGELGPEDPVPNLGLPGPILNSLYANFTFQAIHYPLNYTPQLTSTIAGRHLFYNQSGTSTRYDGNNLAINASDDAAIATDKTAYLWEDAGAATFANVSSFTKGINGIMVDITGSHPNITADDFIFRVGNNNSPGLWGTANAPTSISVRAGAGVGGSDRVEIIWNTGAPIKEWLNVIVLANADTGLAQKVDHPVGHGDAFFFGNAVGNVGTGDTSVNSLVTATDEAAIRANPALVSANIPITNIYDVNRNASVSAVDESAARLNGTNPTTTLKYLNLTTAPAAPEAASVDEGDGGDGGVASALAAPATADGAVSVPKWISNRIDSIDLNSGTPAKLFQYLHDTNTPRSRALLQKLDAAADALGLDDELLDALLADLK